MNKGLIFSTAFVGVTGMAVYPLLAQDDGGLSLTLDLNQKIESASNLGLEVPDEGNTNLATTSLTFNLTSNTNSQSLSLTAGGLIRAGSLPSSNDASTGFSDPSISLVYSRGSQNSAFDVKARVRQSEIAFIRPLSDFVDEDGIPVLPEDFGSLNGSGLRTSFGFSTNFETGINNAVGFAFDAGISGTNYTDTPSTRLNDTQRTNLSTTAILRMTNVTTGRVRASYDRFTSENAQDTDRQTYGLTFGLDTDISETTTLGAGIGYEIIETDEISGTSTEEGLTGEISMSRALSNGAASASLVSSRDQTGDRLTFKVGRSLELPRGSLSISAGATSSNGDSPNLIGNISWQHQMVRSSTSLRVGRSVSTNSEDEERIATNVGLGFDHAINDLSGIGLNFDYGLTEATPTSNRVESSSLSLSYRRAITEDWNLRTGISHEIRDERTVGTADSTSVFVNLHRKFNLIP